MASFWVGQSVKSFPVCDDSDANACPHCNIGERRADSVAAESILSISTSIDISIDAAGAT